MSGTLRAFLAGAAGIGVAFGIAELVHGVYGDVPSVLDAISQRVIERTPGGLATAAIGSLGTAATPVLFLTILILSAVLCGALAALSLRSRLLALVGVLLLGAAALFATLSQPFAAPAATVLAVVVALAAGAAASGLLLRASPEPEGRPASASPGRMRGTGERETSVGRGNFLALSGGALAVGLVALGAGRLLGSRAERTPAAEGPSNSGGETGGAVQRQDKLPPPPEGTSIDVKGMPDLITPASNFYLIDTAVSSPRVDRESWTLKLSGAVDNPFRMTYEELLEMPTREADITLSCVSNEVGGSLVSNGRWTGVLLSDVLAEAGVSRDKISRSSEQLVGRSVDNWEGGFRTRTALDGREALVAFGLNGGELPMKHGYPVRLVVPGLYGYVSATKWLQEIRLTDWNYDTYWAKRGWAKVGPVKTQSRIDTIGDGDELQAGTVPVGGVAWAPHRGIERVEVSTDGGESWNEARLAEELDRDTWRQYVYEWDAAPGEYTVQVRATDGEGNTQTAERAEPIPSGATGYHTISVTVT